MQSRPLTASTKIVLLLLGIITLTVVPVVTQDTINYTQGRGRAAACKANLRQIGFTVQSYQTNHSGRMPPTLKALYPARKSQSLFICPISGYVDRREVSYDYRFLAMPKGSDVICWDSRPHRPMHSVFVWLNRPNRNVLLADGQVKNIAEEEFQKLHLAGQNFVVQ